jgi:FMN-dependent NADH-azoreductase
MGRSLDQKSQTHQQQLHFLEAWPQELPQSYQDLFRQLVPLVDQEGQHGLGQG